MAAGTLRADSATALGTGAVYVDGGTLATNGTQVKILAWYDNEWGYANRLVELARKVALRLLPA